MGRDYRSRLRPPCPMEGCLAECGWGSPEEVRMLPDVAKKIELDGIFPERQYLWSWQQRASGTGRSYRVTLTRGSEELTGQAASLILKQEMGRRKTPRQEGKGSFWFCPSCPSDS